MPPWTVNQVNELPYNDKRRLLRELLDFFGCNDKVPKNAVGCNSYLKRILVDTGCDHFEVVYEKRTRAELTKKAYARKNRQEGQEQDEEDNQADVADYKSLKKFADTEDFSELSTPLKKFKTDFDSLLSAQVVHFFYLLGLLHVFVDKFAGGASKFYGYERYIWNSKIWFRILIQLSKFDVNREGQDCFKSTLKRSPHGRSSTTIRNKDFNFAALVCLLVQGPPKMYKNKKGNLRVYDCSHRCHEKSCVHPGHLIFESHKKNIKRCVNSDRFLCECKPCCIWTIDGRYLPCRNDLENKARECNCGYD